MKTYPIKIRYFIGNAYLQWRKYPNGNTSLTVMDVQDGCPICKASSNIDEMKLPEDEMLVKVYGENAGVLEFLKENGIARPTGRTVEVGYTTLVHCKILIK